MSFWFWFWSLLSCVLPCFDSARHASMRARNGRHKMRPSSVATPAADSVATKAARTMRPVSSSWSVSLPFALMFETPDEEVEEDRHESQAAAVPVVSKADSLAASFVVNVDDTAAASVDCTPDDMEEAEAEGDAEDEDDANETEDKTAIGAFIIARMRSPPTRCSSDVTDGADMLAAVSAAAVDEDEEDEDDDNDASRAGVFEGAAATAEDDEEWAEAEAEDASTWSVSFHASMRVSCASRLRRMRSIRNLKRRSSAS